MRGARNLEQTPSLVDADVADDIRRTHAAIRVGCCTGRREANRQVVYKRTFVHDGIVETNGARHAVAELRGVLDVAHAGDVVIAAEQERGVVARIAMPRRGIGRCRLTEGEASELDEQEFHDHEAVAGRAQQVAVVAEVGREHVRVERCTTQSIECEVALTEGADHAIFGGGTGINRQRQTRTGGEVIAIAVHLTGIAAPRRSVLNVT